jgi:hypothetical protein
MERVRKNEPAKHRRQREGEETMRYAFAELVKAHSGIPYYPDWGNKTPDEYEAQLRTRDPEFADRWRKIYDLQIELAEYLSGKTEGK